MKLIAKIVCIATALFLTYNLFFFWTNTVADSYFYWAFGEFIKSGVYPFTYPFIYARPTTISPPLYSVLLAFLSYLPKPDLLLRCTQTLLLIGSGVYTYKILQKKFSRELSCIIACMLVLLPANIIYTNYIMTEIMAQFFVTYITHLLLSQNKRLFAHAILIAIIGTLAKYSLIIYAAIASAALVSSGITRKFLVYPLIAGIILISWVYINWRVTGVLGLSDSKGIQLYNQIVWIGGVIPSAQSRPMQILHQYVPKNMNLRAGYWDIQEYILSKTQRQWSEVDRIIGNVAKEAIKEHPLAYVVTTAKIFISLHGNAAPYWANLNSFGKTQGAYPLFCGLLGAFKTCAPIISTKYTFGVWNAFIDVSNIFYTFIFPIITYGIFLPSLFVGLFVHQKIWKYTSILYMVGVTPIAMYVHPDTRYIIPFYPLMMIISTFGASALLHVLTSARDKQTLSSKRS